MGAILGLRCRECGREYPAEPIHVCEYCFAPLEVVYDYDEIRSLISPERIAGGPRSIWRYADLLPGSEKRVDLGAGFTPLVPAPRLGAELGLRDLWIKNDTVNPTHSFKDRVVSVALTVARDFGFNTAACASTGNLANAVAAHAAHAGMSAYIFIPSDLEQGKIVATAVYGPQLVAVQGTYDDVNRLCSEIAGQYEWAFVNVNIRPYYAEGSKSLAFEIAEQFGWRAPDIVVAPVAVGETFIAAHRGFAEMERVGWIERRPRMVAAQAARANAVTRAWREQRAIEPIKIGYTVAEGLAAGDPGKKGAWTLALLRESGGVAGDAEDEEILEAQKLLARTEGIWAGPTGVATLAVLSRLLAEKAVDPATTICIILSETGLKTEAPPPSRQGLAFDEASLRRLVRDRLAPGVS
jgi:threonine synthase